MKEHPKTYVSEQIVTIWELFFRRMEVEKKMSLPRNPIDRRRRQFSAPRCTS